MAKKFCFLMFIFSFLVLNFSIINATYINNKNVENYFRLHVVANSDSIEDQFLKLKVYERVNEYIIKITKHVSSKQQAKEIISEKIYNILDICNEVIVENNKDYEVKAYIGRIEFGVKKYNQLKFDAGIYDSLKIVIGDGIGENFWSLIYPTSINYDEKEEDNNTIYSFKLIEIIQNIFKKERKQTD